jgi:anti-sigma regulatory factor (Ser/Thr protein kinase)
MESHLLDARIVSLPALFQPGAGTATGGDFYDGFSLPDGTITVAIGQVIGCGIMAGAVKEQVRAGLRNAALASSEPNAIFTALDQLVSGLDLNRPAATAGGQDTAHACEAGLGNESCVTALLGVFDPATGELCLASAGQLPPAVVRHQHAPGTASSAQRAPGRLAEFAKVEVGRRLGIAGIRPVLRLTLEEGDALVAFTDGLLERHEGNTTQARERLLRTLSTMASTAPRSISQHVVDELIGGQGLEHDGALLVVVRDSQVHHLASVLVSPQSSAVGGARRWVQGQLESWGLDQEVEAAAVMGVSELVTNVVLHAGTPARVSMELADRLLVTVEDTGTRGVPQPHTGVDSSATGGRGLALVAGYSDAMGLSSGVRGSTVWFEIVRDPVTP